jgi:hypothetical protein
LFLDDIGPPNGQRLVCVVVPHFSDALFAKDSGGLDTSSLGDYPISAARQIN